MRKRAIVIAFAAVAALVLAACGSSSTSTHQSTTTGKQMTVAWIYVGSPSDAGWTHQHDLGRQAVQQAFGSKVKTVYKQNVPVACAKYTFGYFFAIAAMDGW